MSVSEGDNVDARLLHLRSHPDGAASEVLAEELLSSERTAEALEVVSLGLSAEPDRTGLIVLAGRGYLQKGDLLRAQQAFVRAAKAEPTDKEPYRWLGEVLLRRGDPERALRVLSRAQAIDAQDEVIQRLYERASRAAEKTKSEPPAARPSQPVSVVPQVATLPPDDDDDAPTQVMTASRFKEMTEAVQQKAQESRRPRVSQPREHGAPSPFPPAPSSVGAVEAPGAESQGPVLATPEEIEARAAAQVERNIRPEDPDAVLGMLKDRGVFEAEASEDSPWVAARDMPREGTRTWAWHVGLWAIVAACLSGGYYFYSQVIAREGVQARELIAQAEQWLSRADHADRVRAYEALGSARELVPTDSSVHEWMLIARLEGMLEDGDWNIAALQSALNRAERHEVSGPVLSLGQAASALTRSDHAQAREALAAAKEHASGAAHVRYLVSRIDQRLGEESAAEGLAALQENEPEFVAAKLALAQSQARGGQSESAVALVQEILAADPEHLRAGLWAAYWTADQANADQIMTSLAGLEGQLASSSIHDRVIAALIRARVQRARGETEAAHAAVEKAWEASPTDPEVLASVAREALAVGHPEVARRAATAAVAKDGQQLGYRLLLAEVWVSRSQGTRALEVLRGASDEDPRVLEWSTRAALTIDTPAALEAAAEALKTYLDAHEDAPNVLRALRLRALIHTDRETNRKAAAARLVRQTRGNPDAVLAAAEAALNAREATAALQVLNRHAEVTANSADAQFLVGRAERMRSNSEAAETAFRRAMALGLRHTPAAMALGFLLLDTGKYEEARVHYERWVAGRVAGEADAGVQAAQLGRVEALVGLGQVTEAQAAWDALADDLKDDLAGRVAGARLALAQDKPRQAVSLLRAAATSNAPNLDVLALYGDAQYAAGKYSSARETYEDVLDRDAEHPEALLGFADILFRSRKYRDALQIVGRLQSTLTRRIRSPEVRAKMLLIKGRSHLERRELPEARNALRSASVIAQTPPAVWFYLGESLSGANSPDSRAAYSKYLELAPQGPLAGRARRAVE